MSDLLVQYLLNGSFADTSPDDSGAMFAQGNGRFDTAPGSTYGIAYTTYASGDQCRSPAGIIGDLGNTNWTFRWRARGGDWDAPLSSISKGVIALSEGNTTNNSRLGVFTSTSNDNFVAAGGNANDSNADFVINTSVAAVNSQTTYFSLTRNGDKIYFHIQGELAGQDTITADATYDFSLAYISGLSLIFATSATDGWIADIEFFGRALYDDNNYTPPPAGS